jgi:hypothetical protein
MTDRRRHIVYTRDAVVPLSDHDREMESGWRRIAVPSSDDCGWIIVDSIRDRKTGWAHIYYRRRA